MTAMKLEGNGHSLAIHILVFGFCQKNDRKYITHVSWFHQFGQTKHFLIDPYRISFTFQARHKGHDYVFSLLSGYRDPPAGVSVISTPSLLTFN